MFTTKYANTIVEQLNAQTTRRIEFEKFLEDSTASLETPIRDICLFAKALMKAQSYGGYLERFLKRRFGLNDAPDNKSGDASCVDGNIEIKVSLGDKNGNWVLQQVRPHHNIQFYLVLCYSIRDDQARLFIIPHDICIDLCKKYGGLAHGTKDRYEQQTDIELGFRFNQFSKPTTQLYRAWNAISVHEKTEQEVKNFFNQEDSVSAQLLEFASPP